MKKTDGRGYMMDKFFANLTTFILQFRLGIIVVLLGVTILLALQMQHLRLETSNEIWFVKGDRPLELMNKFNAVFDNDDFLYILVETGNRDPAQGFFNHETISLISELIAAIKKEVPYIRDMTWLGNVEYIIGKADSIEISELIQRAA